MTITKIKDRLTLAAVSGLLGFAPSRILNHIERRFGYSDISYDTRIASLFLPQSIAQTHAGNLVGVVGNVINSAISASATTYLLCATGRDKAILKGMGLAAVLWVAVDGVFMGMVRHRKSQRPLMPLLTLVDHVIFGAVAAMSVTYLGDDSLFPDNATVNEKLPLVNTGFSTQLEFDKRTPTSLHPSRQPRLGADGREDLD